MKIIRITIELFWDHLVNLINHWRSSFRVFFVDPNNNPCNYCKSIKQLSKHKVQWIQNELNNPWIDLWQFWIIQYFWHHEMLSCCLSRYYCIVNNCSIVAFINSSLYSCETYRQVKEMDNLNLFIDYHYKCIVSIIRVKHILTLHLSTANWRIKLTTGCCCKNAASCYAISFCLVESIPQFLELWPIPMHVQGTSNFTLLYRNATTYRYHGNNHLYLTWWQNNH